MEFDVKTAKTGVSSALTSELCKSVAMKYFNKYELPRAIKPDGQTDLLPCSPDTEQLKLLFINYTMNRKLYKDEELLEITKKVVQKNNHFDHWVATSICKEVMTEFDL